MTKILVLSEDNPHEILSHSENDGVSVHAHRRDGFYDFTPQANNKHRTLSELTGAEKYIAFGNDQNDFIMLCEAEISVFIGEREDFSSATYYTAMNHIPALLNHLESKKVKE